MEGRVRRAWRGRSGPATGPESDGVPWARNQKAFHGPAGDSAWPQIEVYTGRP
jgi:hypothetical protein